MRILIDVDGVMLNTQEALLTRLNHRYGTRYTLDNVTNYHWFENVYKDINPWAELEDEDFWYEEVSLIDGAEDAVNYFIDRGHEVYFVTASHVCNPALDAKMFCLKTHMGFTEKWLDNHVIITQHKELIEGNVLIDDCPENIHKWRDTRFFYNNHARAILFGQPWNENQDNSQDDTLYPLFPHKRWEEIKDIVTRLEMIN